MDLADLNEHLAELQHGTGPAAQFVRLVLAELLGDMWSEICALDTVSITAHEAELRSAASVCGLNPELWPVLGAWCEDIAADYALEGYRPGT